MWVMDKLFKTQIEYLQIGFDLELYQPHEYLSIFWYLEHLFNLRASQIRSIVEYNHNIKGALAIAARGGGKNKKKGGKKKGPRSANNSKVQDTLYLQEVNAQSHLVRGIVRYFVILVKFKKMDLEPYFPFGSNAKRYYNRFSAFYKARAPGLMMYDRWVDALHQFKMVKVANVSTGANTELIAARTTLEKLINTTPTIERTPEQTAELKSLMKVAVGNSVQLQMMSKLHTYRNPDKNIKTTFADHLSYCVVALN
eukprot:TRINITY_DN415_c1_g1_i3.p1 TRINITY_DN415_c1_g1~~TRINITY_DN415_c1_g1_i3.p1  ORF type:complete len:287 (-),score=57.51 TRINITY_DN415_c1_g1_i3:47-808(-)